MNAAKIVGIQYAALPYRVDGRRVRILLITSRGSRRWVIPKGWPIGGLTPQDTAATEAAEEASRPPRPSPASGPRLTLRGPNGEATEYPLGASNVLGRSTTASVPA